MKNNFKRKNQLLFAAVSSILSATMAMSDAHAGAYQEMASLLDHNGIVVGGWANGGITYNGNEPQNNFNGTATFGDLSAQPQLNQLNVFVQRAVATEGNKWDFGGRFDFMYGTDSIFTQAYGVPSYDVNTGMPQSRSVWDLNMMGTNTNRYYDIALPQAYLESYVPIGNGINLKLGHFYTPIGYESVPAPDNFFYTHAYTMQFGEPFTHTGLMANYTVNDNWAVMGGLLTGSATGGWDGGWDKDLSNWSGLMGATVTSNDKNTSLNVSGTYGMSSANSQHAAPWAIYSVVLKHNVSEKFHLVLQHDHGFADNAYFNYMNTNGTITGINKNAEWYGVNSHFIYDVTEKVTAGIRAEWFRDQDGLRVCAPGRVSAATDPNGNSYAAGGVANYSTCGLNGGMGATYYEFTAGVTWKPKDWIRVRPNVRYDIVGDAHGYSPFVIRGSGFTPNTPGQTVNSQILFSTDVTFTF